jgi:hypothetical protein
MAIKHISFRNRKLNFYSIQCGFYAVDSDIAAFLRIGRSALLSESYARNKDYPVGVRIELTDDDCSYAGAVREGDNNVYGFSLEGVILLAYGMDRGGMCSNIAVKLFGEGSMLHKRILGKYADKKFWEEFRESNKKWLVDLALSRNKFLDNTYDSLCGVVANSVDLAYSMLKELEKEMLPMFFWSVSVPPAMKSLANTRERKENKIKFISVNGKKLKLFYLREDYYALDTDLAEFFGVERKYMLRQASSDRSDYTDKERIYLNRDELKEPGSCSRQRAAFNPEGIMITAIKLNRGETSRKLAYEALRESSKMVKTLRDSTLWSRWILVYRSWFNWWMIESELKKHKLSDEEREKYESDLDYHSREIESLIWEKNNVFSLLDHARIVKNMVKDVPPEIKDFTFPYVDQL